MNAYTAPLRDLRFALHDVLDIQSFYAALPGSESVTRELADAVLEEGAHLPDSMQARDIASAFSERVKPPKYVKQHTHLQG